jgi:arginase
MAALLGAPTSLGAFAPGQEHAPRALREAGLDRAGLTDLGDLPLRRWAPDRASRRAQNADAVAEYAAELAARVPHALEHHGRLLVLGGDCTIELGVVSGALRAGLEDLGLVYFDMHPDLNTPETVSTGTLDWMGVAHMLDLPGAHPAIAGIGPRRPLLGPDRLVLLAPQADQTKPEEQRAIADHGIATVPIDDVAADPRGAATRALDASEAEHLLVHFDVDVVDFVDLPLSENTGHNIGLPFDTAVAVVGALLEDDRVRALTVTEHNPAHGADDGSASATLAAALATLIG